MRISDWSSDVGSSDLALGALVVVGCWTNLSLALVYQRPSRPPCAPSFHAPFVHPRHDVSQSLGLDPAIPLRTGRDLPDTAPRGTLFVVGDCEGLYLSDGMRTDAIKHTPWNGVERGEAGGRFRLEVVFDDAPAGSREPLLSIDAGDEAGMIWAERGAGGVAIGFGGVGFAAESRVLPIADGRAHELDLLVDVHLRQIQVVVDGQRVLETILPGDLPPPLPDGPLARTPGREKR